MYLAYDSAQRSYDCGILPHSDSFLQKQICHCDNHKHKICDVQHLTAALQGQDLTACPGYLCLYAGSCHIPLSRNPFLTSEDLHFIHGIPVLKQALQVFDSAHLRRCSADNGLQPPGSRKIQKHHRYRHQKNSHSNPGRQRCIHTQQKENRQQCLYGADTGAETALHILPGFPANSLQNHLYLLLFEGAVFYPVEFFHNIRRHGTDQSYFQQFILIPLQPFQYKPEKQNRHQQGACHCHHFQSLPRARQDQSPVYQFLHQNNSYSTKKARNKTYQNIQQSMSECILKNQLHRKDTVTYDFHLVPPCPALLKGGIPLRISCLYHSILFLSWEIVVTIDRIYVIFRCRSTCRQIFRHIYTRQTRTKKPERV